MKNTVTAVLLSCVSLYVVAGSEVAQPKIEGGAAQEKTHEQTQLEISATKPETEVQKPLLEEYEGQHRDIEKVISIEELPQKKDPNESSSCKVVPMEMIYDDSKGKEHDLEYKELERNCASGN